MTRTRRHHNNRGDRQVRRGKTRDQVRHMARRLKVRYATEASGDWTPDGDLLTNPEEYEEARRRIIEGKEFSS